METMGIVQARTPEGVKMKQSISWISLALICLRISIWR